MSEHDDYNPLVDGSEFFDKEKVQQAFQTPARSFPADARPIRPTEYYIERRGISARDLGTGCYAYLPPLLTVQAVRCDMQADFTQFFDADDRVVYCIATDQVIGWYNNLTRAQSGDENLVPDPTPDTE